MNDQLTTDETCDSQQPESEGRVVLQRLVRPRCELCNVTLGPTEQIPADQELPEQYCRDCDLLLKCPICEGRGEVPVPGFCNSRTGTLDMALCPKCGLERERRFMEGCESKIASGYAAKLLEKFDKLRVPTLRNDMKSWVCGLWDMSDSPKDRTPESTADARHDLLLLAGVERSNGEVSEVADR